MLALRLNYVLAGTRRRGPLRDLQAGTRCLAHLATPAIERAGEGAAVSRDGFDRSRRRIERVDKSRLTSSTEATLRIKLNYSVQRVKKQLTRCSRTLARPWEQPFTSVRTPR